MDKENKDEINDSRSATVLKTIYSILVLIIVINCILLIVSVFYKNTNNEPIRSTQKFIIKEKETPKNQNKKETPKKGNLPQ